jgi:hypothetical protein
MIRKYKYGQFRKDFPHPVKYKCFALFSVRGLLATPTRIGAGCQTTSGSIPAGWVRFDGSFHARESC